LREILTINLKIKFFPRLVKNAKENHPQTESYKSDDLQLSHHYESSQFFNEKKKNKIRVSDPIYLSREHPTEVSIGPLLVQTDWSGINIFPLIKK